MEKTTYQSVGQPDLTAFRGVHGWIPRDPSTRIPLPPPKPGPPPSRGRSYRRRESPTCGRETGFAGPHPRPEVPRGSKAAGPLESRSPCSRPEHKLWAWPRQAVIAIIAVQAGLPAHSRSSRMMRAKSVDWRTMTLDRTGGWEPLAHPAPDPADVPEGRGTVAGGRAPVRAPGNRGLRQTPPPWKGGGVCAVRSSAPAGAHGDWVRATSRGFSPPANVRRPCRGISATDHPHRQCPHPFPRTVQLKKSSATAGGNAS